MKESVLDIKIRLLKNAELFKSCSDEELKIIAQNSRYLNLKKGDVIFSLGDVGRSLYIIKSGEAVVRKPDNENREIDIARFLDGDCFGELDMLTGSKRGAFAYAETKLKVLVFPSEKKLFNDILLKYPSASAGILHGFLISIAGRIRTANSLVKENSPVIQELAKQVYRDKLTGLYNKTYLEEKLKSVISGTKKNVSLIMFKPDNFKEINDKYGHDAGDEALRIIAKKLSDFMPEENIIFRFMGNELAVLMNETDRNSAYSEALKIKDFVSSIDLREAAEGEDIKLSVSIGIASYPDHGDNPEEIIQKAHELPLIGRARGGSIILFPEDK